MKRTPEELARYEDLNTKVRQGIQIGPENYAWWKREKWIRNATLRAINRHGAFAARQFRRSAARATGTSTISGLHGT